MSHNTNDLVEVKIGGLSLFDLKEAARDRNGWRTRDMVVYYNI